MADPCALYRQLTPLRHIKRFQREQTVQRMSVAEHSFYVAMLAGAFARQLQQTYQTPVDAVKVTELGLWHDTAEAMMGDLPHDVKRLSDALHVEWDRIEAQVVDRLQQLAGRAGVTAPSALEALIVKVADWSELVLYVYEERASGNQAIDRAATRILRLMRGPLWQQAQAHGILVAGWYHDWIQSLESEEQQHRVRTEVRGIPLDHET